MRETIFIHCQTFGRKPNRSGNCIRQVIAEGLRCGNCHGHVAQPLPPRVIFGDPAGFEALHDAHVAARRTRVNCNGKLVERKIRADRHTLCTVIASYPVPVRAIGRDREKTAALAAWERATLDWVRALYGTQLKAAFAHDDESHPHLHFWILPANPDADAARLHPGKSAKRETEARLKAEGVSPRMAVKAGNAALKAAMRGWIDAYHRGVGAPLGLHRDGPRRRRLSRAQYRAEAAAMEHHRGLAADRARLAAEVAALETRRLASEARIRDLEATAARYATAASRFQQRMAERARQLEAAGPLLDAVAAEIGDRTIVHVDGIWHVRNPQPFREAAVVWKRLAPVILRLLKMISDAEEGQLHGQGREPRAPAPGTAPAVPCAAQTEMAGSDRAGPPDMAPAAFREKGEARPACRSLPHAARISRQPPPVASVGLAEFPGPWPAPGGGPDAP